MLETFAQYLEKWLKLSTAQGLSNPLVKMPVKRFRLLQPLEFADIADGGIVTIGTTSDPISRNLLKNAMPYIRERDEHIKVTVSEDGIWELNPVLMAHLKAFNVRVPGITVDDPGETTRRLKAQLGNRATQVKDESYAPINPDSF